MRTDPPEAAPEATIAPLEAGRLAGTLASQVETGLIANYAAIAGRDALAVRVNHRSLGTTPVSWEADGVGRFEIDVLDLPPDLLLEPRLLFEVGWPGTPARALARHEIESTALYPLAAVPPQAGALEGFLDEASADFVRGWVWDPSLPTRRVPLRLFVGGLYCGTFDAMRPRQDLLAAGLGDGGYGFEIPIADFAARAGTDDPEIVVVAGEAEAWRMATPVKPASAATGRSPGLRRDGKRGRTPPTLRDFVRDLSAIESFPKRAYVVDVSARGSVPDAFSGDYVLLALEYLRVDLARTGDVQPQGWRERLRRSWRMWLVRGQIRRLGALAQATVISQSLLRPVSKTLQSPLAMPPR